MASRSASLFFPLLSRSLRFSGPKEERIVHQASLRCVRVLTLWHLVPVRTSQPMRIQLHTQSHERASKITKYHLPLSLSPSPTPFSSSYSLSLSLSLPSSLSLPLSHSIFFSFVLSSLVSLTLHLFARARNSCARVSARWLNSDDDEVDVAKLRL